MLETLLDKYADKGVAHIEETQVLTVAPCTEFGAPLEIICAFGGLVLYQQAVHELEDALYLPHRHSREGGNPGAGPIGQWAAGKERHSREGGNPGLFHPACLEVVPSFPRRRESRRVK